MIFVLVDFRPHSIDYRDDCGDDPVAKLLLETTDKAEALDVGTMPTFDHFGLVGFPDPTIRAVDDDLVLLGLSISSTEVGKGEESVFERFRHVCIIPGSEGLSRLFFGIFQKDFILAGLAHPRNLVLSQGDRIAPVATITRVGVMGRDTFLRAGEAPSPLDALDAVVELPPDPFMGGAIKGGEEGVDCGRFVVCFHAPILAQGRAPSIGCGEKE